jgi:hypothetical protein
MYDNIDWLVFNANFSNISAILWFYMIINLKIHVYGSKILSESLMYTNLFRPIHLYAFGVVSTCFSVKLHPMIWLDVST